MRRRVLVGRMIRNRRKRVRGIKERRTRKREERRTTRVVRKRKSSDDRFPLRVEVVCLDPHDPMQVSTSNFYGVQQNLMLLRID